MDVVHRRILSTLLLLASLGFAPARGQEPMPEDGASPAVSSELTPERIESLLRQAESSPELNDSQKKQAGDFYRAALAELERAEELKTRAEQFKAEAESVQGRVEKIKEDLGNLKEKEVEPPVVDSTLVNLEQSLSKQQLKLVSYKKAQSEAELAPKTRSQRRKEIRNQLLALPARIEELSKQAASPPVEEPLPLAMARRTEFEARWIGLHREEPALESELAKYDAEDATDLVRLDRDLNTLRVARAERRIKLQEDRLKELRAVAAREAVRQARDEFVAATPALKPYAERNRQLAEASQSITQRFDAIDKDLKEAEEAYTALFQQFKQTREKVDIARVGSSSAVGALLRKRRESLPDIRARRVAVSNRAATIDQLQYERLEYDDERDELSDPEPLVQQIVRDAAPKAGVDRELLESATRDLLDRKREYLDSLIKNYKSIFETLVELDAKDQQIIALTESYRQYIDERVLWIRSERPLTSAFQFERDDAWIASSRLWIDVANTVWRDMRDRVPLYVAALAISLALVLKGKRFRQELREVSQAVARPGFYSFAPTLRAVALTAAISVAWPGVVGFFAWRLYRSADSDDPVKAVAYGIVCAVALWIPLEMLRQIARPRGLGESHFGWPDSAVELLRRHLRWLILVGLPLTFVAAALAAGQSVHGRDALHRCCFILTMIVLAVFLRRVLHPERGLFREYLAYHRNGWLDRLKDVWYWLGVASPLALAGLAFWGYCYTAQVLTWRLYATICFIVVLVVARALLMRWMKLRRRKLSIEQARQRAAAASQSGDANAAAAAAGIITEPEGADLSAHNAQAQSFLATSSFLAAVVGLWWIWVPVLPALSMLDQWPLWSTSSVAEAVEMPTSPLAAAAQAAASETTTPDGQFDVAVDTHVTYGDLAFAIFIAITTLMCARNVPGLLEISVLQRLPLDASVRYAITSLTSYAIVMFGVVAACSNIGLRWSQVQWLATALTFGLAFGLQEMFANFVAGVIILFERPIRVGDIVTVDDVSGVVSRIRIRATSITNWDRKEYVVPNKEFITGRLLNWTLSDQVNRIVVNVGVAYGSDTELVRQLLLKVADEHPHVLKDPASLATFEGFGDNSLNFVLRTFLPSLENRLQVIHELHTAIDKSFRQAGIEIAFPQRDLHIRTLPAETAAATGGEHSGGGNGKQRSVVPAPIMSSATAPWATTVMPES